MFAPSSRIIFLIFLFCAPAVYGRCILYISDIYDDRSSYHDTDSEVGLQKERQKEILGNNLINHIKK